MQAMRASMFSQDGLGEVIGKPQSTISSWERGEAEPPPHMVFAIEQACGKAPGSLSYALGYVPVGTDPNAWIDVELAIQACPMLTTDERLVLSALFRRLTIR